MNQDGLHLQAIDIAHWGGFVFASLDGAREPFENRTYQFTQYLEQYAEAWSGLREIASWTYDEAVNWKVFVENYIEDYHFSSVHATSLGFYDFSRVDTAMAGEHCRITVPYATSCEESTSETPSVSYQGYMFPGTMFNADRDHVSVFRIRPESAERTFVDVILFSNPNLESRMTRTVEALKSNHHQVMSEDLFMCRGIQQTVHSEAFRPVALAGPGETAIGYFHNTLLARLAE